jgi:two-component system chemotaxis response regulator CheY
VAASIDSTTTVPNTTILVVDDDIDLRESLQELLEMQGYAVSTAEHGRHALELLRGGHRPQLILLDLMMPVMDGAQFLRELRADPELADTTVLLVTAFADRAAGLPAQQILQKPLRIAKFLALLAEILKSEAR